MEIKKIIVRKSTTPSDKYVGMALIMSIDAEKLGKLHPQTFVQDAMYALEVLDKLNQASKLLGFDSFDSMKAFIDMFGVNALMQ